MTKRQNSITEKKAKCPMEGNCQVNDVVYKCDVTRPFPKKCIGKMNESFL